MKDIKVGFIGLGSRGIGLLRDVVLRQGEQVTAVCDTYEDRANEGADAVKNAGQAVPAVYTDYRQVIQDKNVNTIVIATAWESHMDIATHDLGPIAKVLGLNHGNRMLTLSSTASKAAGLQAYIREHKGDDEFLKDKTFLQGDVVTTVIKCARGETIVLTLDTTLPR